MSAKNCWPGYEKQGMKRGKSGKMVNNCVKAASAKKKSKAYKNSKKT